MGLWEEMPPDLQEPPATHPVPSRLLLGLIHGLIDDCGTDALICTTQRTI